MSPTLSESPFIISLPTRSRRVAFDFYTSGLELETVGEPDRDGIPEPLQVILNDRTRLMLVPTAGFEWIIAPHSCAQAATSECVLALTVDYNDEVSALIDRARRAGAQIVTEPGQQPWGYAGAFADPDGHIWMVHSAASERSRD